MNPWVLVADGACAKNPGPGGYGVIVVTPELKVQEFGGSDTETTNNRMELMGFYRGLQEIYKFNRAQEGSSKKIRVILDSSYVIEGAQKNIWNWAKNGWKTVAGGEVKNQDLWEKIMKGLTLLKESQFEFQYEQVKGHAGHEMNERVDQIAVVFSRGATPELYSGPLDQYPVRLDSAPYRPVYLSYVGGVLKRHETWPECEAYVKGKTGVKYKKVTNRLQEEETLKAWGVK